MRVSRASRREILRMMQVLLVNEKIGRDIVSQNNIDPSLTRKLD